jgi:AraC-like DNA-binding protein
MTAPLIVNQTMRPSLDLQHIIEFFWYIKIPSNYPFAGEMVLPNGQIVLALNLSDPMYVTEFSAIGPVKQRFQSVLFGQHNRGLWVEKNGELELLCIYLKTEFLHHYCKIAVSAFAHSPLLPPHDVFGKTIGILEKSGRAGKSLTEKISLVEAIFRRYFCLQFYPDAIFLAAKKLIISSGGQLPIEKVSKDLAVPYKTWQRRFNSLLGISPKFFARTVRFVKVYQQMVLGQGGDLMELALRHGYYDQNHFIKEFKYFTHHTPDKHIIHLLQKLYKESLNEAICSLRI